jgi:hypothetical protein
VVIEQEVFLILMEMTNALLTVKVRRRGPVKS